MDKKHRKIGTLLENKPGMALIVGKDKSVKLLFNKKARNELSTAIDSHSQWIRTALHHSFETNGITDNERECIAEKLNNLESWIKILDDFVPEVLTYERFLDLQTEDSMKCPYCGDSDPTSGCSCVGEPTEDMVTVQCGCGKEYFYPYEFLEIEVDENGS